MSNDGRVNDIIECKIKHKAGYMELSIAQREPQVGVVPP
jgi:hypothetical protein